MIIAYKYLKKVLQIIKKCMVYITSFPLKEENIHAVFSLYLFMGNHPRNIFFFLIRFLNCFFFFFCFLLFFSLKLYFIYSIIYDHYIKVYFLSFACLPRLQFSANNNILGFASFRWILIFPINIFVDVPDGFFMALSKRFW